MRLLLKITGPEAGIIPSATAGIIYSAVCGIICSVTGGIISPLLSELSSDAYTTPELKEAEAAFIDYNCGIVTACRSNFTSEENELRNSRLKQRMKNLGLLFRPISGCYKEAQWKDRVTEIGYFVAQDKRISDLDFFTTLYELAQDDNCAADSQDSVLYKRGGTNKAAFLVATNNAGRTQFRGPLWYAGLFYSNVPQLGDFTACKNDECFAFKLKGILRFRTNYEQIFLAEGDVFDLNGYKPDGVIVLRRSAEEELGKSCRRYKDNIPLLQHVFRTQDQDADQVSLEVRRLLNLHIANKHKTIGILSSVSIDGSFIRGAEEVLASIVIWSKKHKHQFKELIIFDSFGDFLKINYSSYK